MQIRMLYLLSKTKVKILQWQWSSLIIIELNFSKLGMVTKKISTLTIRYNDARGNHLMWQLMWHSQTQRELYAKWTCLKEAALWVKFAFHFVLLINIGFGSILEAELWGCSMVFNGFAMHGWIPGQSYLWKLQFIEQLQVLARAECSFILLGWIGSFDYLWCESVVMVNLTTVFLCSGHYWPSLVPKKKKTERRRIWNKKTCFVGGWPTPINVNHGLDCSIQDMETRNGFFLSA